MTDTKVLYERLRRVNTALNLIEDTWPSGLPSDQPTTVTVIPDRGVPAKYVAEVTKDAERLREGMPAGWEITVPICVWKGNDAGAFIQVFFNGSSAGACGVRVFNTDLDNDSKSYTPSLRAAVAGWPGEVTRLIAKFSHYPLRKFQSKRYTLLCELRRRLNSLWHSTVPSTTPYPYGEHSPGWPTG